MHRSHWRLVSTLVLCSIVTGLCTTQARNADAAGDCLAAPKDSTPQGKHWYYRVDRPTKRACWYLGEEGRSTPRSSTRISAAQTHSEVAASDKTSTQRNAKEPLQPAVADARAELSKDVAVPFITMPLIAQQPEKVFPPRESPAPQANESAPPDSSRFSERWPDQNSNRVAQAEVTAPPAPAQPTPIQQTAPQQATAPIAPAPAPDDSSDMLRIILAALTATIALAAIIGRLIIAHRRPRKRPAPRRPIWQTMVSENADPVHARASHSALRARAETDVEDLLRALRYPEPPRVTLPIGSANRGRRPTDRSGARA